MKESLTERMRHAAEHCEGMYDLIDEAAALREGADEIERLRGFVAHLAVPVGWKLVPARPADAMIEGLRTGSRKDCPGNELCEIRWAAALAKAPTHNA